MKSRGAATGHRVGLASAIVLVASTVDAQRAHPAPRAEPAIAAIVGALDTFPLVAIGELHRNQQVHDLIVDVVRDPRFLPSGGDIVVEFGNARYQDRVDRYVDGEMVGEKELAQVWRDAINILVWDAPVYSRVFATVRDVNRARPPAHRLRVLVADPPIDWSQTRDRDAWEQVGATRDRHFADVVEREVLARGHHALLIFGSGHIETFDQFEQADRRHPPNVAALLMTERPGVLLRLTSDWMNEKLDTLFARWRPPVVLPLKGTSLGEVHLGPPSETPQLKGVADRFLYLGPTSSLTTSTPAPEVYADTAYLRELLRRDTIQGGHNAGELRRLSARFLPGAPR